ncbi:MAG TPA: PEP-CTERM sorting domain-containing protein [Gemmatimonadales bacterium]
MRARTIIALAMLSLALGARPLAAEGPVVFQRDGTFFYSLHAELRAQAAAAAEESDSTEAPKLVAIAGGASLAGLAAYFIASGGNGNPLGGPPHMPLTDPPGGGITIPPPEQSAPALPNQPYTPPGGNTPGGTMAMPTTTTPEPVSMTLLATGLAGIGAARLKRRRRG